MLGEGEDLQATIVSSLLTPLRQAACRGVLLISGSDEWIQAQIDVFPVVSGDSILIANRPLAGLQPSERRLVLGSECDCLLWDIFSRPDVNTLAASAGCLVRGGLLIILAPEPEDWSSALQEADGNPSLFWQHVLRCLEEWPYLARLSEGKGWQTPGPAFPQLEEDRSLPTADQLQVMARLRRVLHGHRRRPLVIRADRGRGKSALLGLCAAEFLLENRGDILITAPRRDAVRNAFVHARQALALDAQSSDGHVHFGDSRFYHVSPDRLLSEQPAARIVLVDEAAAIPPAVLAEIVRAYPRVVFATTVHGYEGSGRGFDIRFSALLDALTPQWQSCELQEAIRWSEGDPLESLINRCFMLDAEPPSAAVAVEAEDCRVEWLDNYELLADEARLRQLFGLLVDAHYQTSPSDLQQLLDSPAISVFALMDTQEHICGAALVIEEGGLADDMLDRVQSGERRLRGHLLPQSLVYHLGLDDGLRLRCARISRIAVEQSSRRRGLGQALLAGIEAFALANGIDYLGSSFAADPDVLPFWLGADYLPLRLGIRRDPCSGSHALMVAKPLSQQATEVLSPAQERFLQHFPLELREVFSALDWRVALTLLNQGQGGGPIVLHDQRSVQRFAAGEIAYEHAYPALTNYLLKGWPRAAPEREETGLVIEKVLQAKSWKALAKAYSLKGRADVEHRLRQGFRLFLSLENNG